MRRNLAAVVSRRSYYSSETYITIFLSYQTYATLARKACRVLLSSVNLIGCFFDSTVLPEQCVDPAAELPFAGSRQDNI